MEICIFIFCKTKKKNGNHLANCVVPGPVFKEFGVCGTVSDFDGLSPDYIQLYDRALNIDLQQKLSWAKKRQPITQIMTG